MPVAIDGAEATPGRSKTWPTLLLMPRGIPGHETVKGNRQETRIASSETRLDVMAAC